MSGPSDAVRPASDASSPIDLELSQAATDDDGKDASRDGGVAGETLRGVLAYYLEFIGEPAFGKDKRNSIWL